MAEPDFFGSLAGEAAGLGQMLADTFLTEVPGQGAESGALSPASAAQGGGAVRAGSASTQGPVAGLVQHQVVPPFVPDRPSPLPGKVPPSRIMQSAADTLPFESERSQRWWQATFLSEPSVEVLQDVFWWFFCQKFRPEGSQELQYQLFDRAADNFAMLFMSVTDKKKDAFFETYHEALAQAVFAGFWTAYPKSQKATFDRQAFKSELRNMVRSSQLPPPPRSCYLPPEAAARRCPRSVALGGWCRWRCYPPLQPAAAAAAAAAAGRLLTVRAPPAGLGMDDRPQGQRAVDV